MRTRTLSSLVAVMLCFFAIDAEAQEKRLVIYSSNESTLSNLVIPIFQQETGIRVDIIEVGSGVVMRRLAAEKDRPQGDLVWGLSRLNMNNNKTYFLPYLSKNNEAIPNQFRDPDGYWTGTNLQILVILANSKLVAPADEPKKWDDLLAPRWKNKIAMTDPSNSGSTYINLTMFSTLWGNGKDIENKKLTALLRNSRIVNKASLVFQGVGTGEYELGVSLEYAGYLWQTNGAPVKVIYPSDGSVAVMEGVAVIKNGPNTEEAKKFIDFINRKDISELMLSKMFRRPTRQDLNLSALPGQLPDLSSIKIVPYDEEYWANQRATVLGKLQDMVQTTR